MKGKSEVRVVTFKLGNEQYGISVQNVREIIKAKSYTKIPNAPPYFEGVINLRGQILPVINLKKLLKGDTSSTNFSENNRDDKSRDPQQARIIIAELDEESFGLLVDQVIGVMQIDKDSIAPLPSYVMSGEHPVVDSIIKSGEDLVMLLDIRNLLSKVTSGTLHQTEPRTVMSIKA
ncbi:MAG: chemotaxis protein CheW [Candidatus Nezhaarchaeales archaeon]